MESPERSEHAQRRKQQRVGILRRRAALASTLGFAAFLALAASHAVGSAKHAVPSSTAPSQSAAPARYFDEQPGGFAFDDAQAVSAAPPAPVAQTHVS